MKLRERILVYIILIAATVIFLIIEKLTHIEFMLHLAAIPLEVLVVVFIVEKYLEGKEKREKRKQLGYIKSCLFRSEMHNLFLANFKALKEPDISMQRIKNSNLDELKKMREEANRVEYKSLEEMEPVIMEYVDARSVWHNFMDLAMSYGFEEIVEDMLYILHFVHDVRIFKERNPDKLFIHEAAKNEYMMQKVKRVLGDGIRKFLDYTIELKETQPEMFYAIVTDYELSSQMRE